MNNVTIIGQLEGEPQLIYTNKDGDKKLYKLLLKVSKPYKNQNGDFDLDFVNIKAWNNVLEDEYALFDEAMIGVEGRISSFSNQDKDQYFNEIVARKVMSFN